MDEPEALAAEWDRKKIVPALIDLYDEIWVYGLPQLNDPMAGIEVPPSVRHKTVYTGYLKRELPLHTDTPHELLEIDGPFILVTAGGGGDGDALVDWVLRGLTRPIRHIPYGAGDRVRPLHVEAAARESFKERAAKFPNLRTLTFTNNLGALMNAAAGVVSMGGYNTFCEILSFDKRALIVPRTPAPARAVHPRSRGAVMSACSRWSTRRRAVTHMSWPRPCASCRSRACRATSSCRACSMVSAMSGVWLRGNSPMRIMVRRR